MRGSMMAATSRFEDLTPDVPRIRLKLDSGFPIRQAIRLSRDQQLQIRSQPGEVTLPSGCSIPAPAGMHSESVFGNISAPRR